MTTAKAIHSVALLAVAAAFFLGFLAPPAANAQFHSNRGITGSGGGANSGDPDVLARTIVHLNGDYTTTVKDKNSHVLTLETYSPEKQLLESRVVRLDGRDKATVFQVLDPHGSLRYVGQMIYDAYGRFQEEVLYNTAKQVVRRRVQEYTPSGKPMRVKTYFANGVPADLHGEVTLEMMQGNVSAGRSAEEASGSKDGENKSFLKKLWPFGKKDGKKD